MSKIKPIAKRYSGDITITLTDVEYKVGRIRSGFAYKGFVSIPNRLDWHFEDLRPSTIGPSGTHPDSLDHAALAALGFYGYEGNDKWSKDHHTDDVYGFGLTRDNDAGTCTLFQIQHTPNGKVMLEGE